MTLFRISALATAAVAMAATCNAQLVGNLLLRQGSFSNTGFTNQWYGDLPASSTGMGSLVTSGSAWSISSVQVLQNGDNRAGFTNSWFGNVTQAWFNVSRQVAGAPDPGIDPGTNINNGPNVVMSVITPVVLDMPTSNINGANQSFRMTVSTAAMTPLQNLAAGDYVFSLVAIANRTGQFGRGETFTSSATQLGSTTDYVRNPFGGANLPSGNDWGTLAQDFSSQGAVNGTKWAIGINGTPVPEPASVAALGLGAFALIRRRRRLYR